MDTAFQPKVLIFDNRKLNKINNEDNIYDNPLYYYYRYFQLSYLRTITKQVNFRKGSSSSANNISSLKPNTQIFIVSLKTENDYYNMIIGGRLAENLRKTNYIKKRNMQKIDEPDNFETDNSKYLKWIIYTIIFIAIIIFKAAAKKEIRENANEEIESTYNNEE